MHFSRTRCVLTLCSAVLLALCLTAVSEASQKKKRKKRRRPNPAFAKITDDPKLPRVLLIGDSISIGYTVAVRRMLKGKANVHRIPTNGGPTTRGVQRIDRWLGKSQWDVIHFNWGLHDLKFIRDRRQVSPEEYEKNLTKLVTRLKKTGAKLIWCSTTPVPKGVKPPRTNDDVLLYNKIAAKIMKSQNIATDDLYSFAAKQRKKIQRPSNVHFTRAGSKVLARNVVRSIEAGLKKE